MIKNFDEPSNAFIHMNLSEIIFEKPGAQIKNGRHFISTEARLITCSTVEVQNKYTQFDWTETFNNFVSTN